MSSSLYYYGQYRDICRIDARNLGCLCQCLWFPPLQLLTALKSHCRALVIIKPLGYFDSFINLCFFSCFPLLFDVWSILSHNLFFAFYLILRKPFFYALSII